MTKKVLGLKEQEELNLRSHLTGACENLVAGSCCDRVWDPRKMGDFTNFWEYSKSNKLDHDNQLFRIQAVHHFLEEGISLAQA